MSESTTSSTTVVGVRLTNEEKELVEALAKYLHKLGKIKEPTISDAIRVCIYFTVNEILKAIEAERFAR